MIRLVFLRWLPLAGLASALCLLVYASAQQTGRTMANDPQIQIARDTKAALASGQPITTLIPQAQTDLATSLSPFITAVGENGSIIASSARLRGQPRSVPAGVLESVKKNGEERVTWQPEPGVRMATVVVRNPGPSGGFIVVGRSLSETEARIRQLGSLLFLGWAATLIGVLILVTFSESFADRR
jgi:hypothetical protein